MTLLLLLAYLLLAALAVKRMVAALAGSRPASKFGTHCERPPVSKNYVQLVLDRLHAESPGLDPDLAQLYALLVMTKGVETTLEDVHEAWGLWRNTTNPAHRSLIPFSELTPEVQELDRVYVDAIHRTAKAAA